MKNRVNIKCCKKFELQTLIKILFDFPVPIFFDKRRQIYEESCIKFSNLRFKKKNFQENVLS